MKTFIGKIFLTLKTFIENSLTANYFKAEACQ